MINIARIAKNLTIANPRLHCTFSRARRPSIPREDQFQQSQKNYANNYFEQYRSQVEKDSVIRDFRSQVFQRDNQAVGERQYESRLDNQQRHLESLLKNGDAQEIHKYSKKIMQHISNKRKMFKTLDQNNSDHNVFKDYADYSTYKTNKVGYEDRNYGMLDNLTHGKRAQRTYQFVDSLPDDYAEKAEIKEEMKTLFPHQYSDMSISEFGKRVQTQHDLITRINDTAAQYSHANRGKMSNVVDHIEEGGTIYDNTEDIIGTATGQQEQTGVMSTEAWNTIYQLYLQGWTVRQISQRFGILPLRTKFMIWARARFFNEAVPKFGAKFLIYAYKLEQQEAQEHGVCDYGLDLDEMQIGSTYDEITAWVSHRVDTQRTPDQYNECLRKLEKKKPAYLSRQSRVQVGEHGEGNKKHRLVEWRRHRGKGSDQYFLKNKIFQKLMYEGRKVKDVYY